MNEELKKVEGVPEPCCGDPANIDLEATTSEFLIIRRCRVCRRRHWLHLVQPIRIEMVMKE